MGRKVAEAVESFSDATVLCGVDVVEKDLGFKVYDSFSKVTEKPDVIIDFSSPVCTPNVLDYAVSNGVPAVLCSTGYTAEDIEKINDASKKVAIFRSANMSLGVNAIISLVKSAAKILYGFDIEIIEKHHNQKLDAPSGTAITIANDILAEVERKKSWRLNEFKTTEELQIVSKRIGTVPGIHVVEYDSAEDVIEIKHSAKSRRGLAFGAVLAAEFVQGKTGVFGMKDLLNI